MNTLNLLFLFFYVVAVIAIVLCFFILWVSFDANIREHLWEFGVLRSVGMSAMQLIRSFIYESLAMIIIAATLGTAVGMTVAVTLTMEQNLFTELPFHFSFPSAL